MMEKNGLEGDWMHLSKLLSILRTFSVSLKQELTGRCEEKLLCQSKQTLIGISEFPENGSDSSGRMLGLS